MNIVVRPTQSTDADYIVHYRNNFDTCLFLTDCNLYSSEQTANWINNLPSSSKRFSLFGKVWDGQIGFDKVICSHPITVSSAVPLCLTGFDFVGMVRVDNIDYVNSNCYVGLDLVQEARGKKLSVPIYDWLLNYLFFQLNMNAVYLKVLDINDKALKLYQKLGFEENGRIPEQVFRNGRYRDYIHMSMLRDDWKVIKELGGV